MNYTLLSNTIETIIKKDLINLTTSTRKVQTMIYEINDFIWAEYVYYDNEFATLEFHYRGEGNLKVLYNADKELIKKVRLPYGELGQYVSEVNDFYKKSLHLNYIDIKDIKLNNFILCDNDIEELFYDANLNLLPSLMSFGNLNLLYVHTYDEYLKFCQEIMNHENIIYHDLHWENNYNIGDIYFVPSQKHIEGIKYNQNITVSSVVLKSNIFNHIK